jgi:hypothetical protein
LHIVLPPPPLGHPPIAITPDKVEKYPEKRGGQGDAPLGLLPPLFGERGVTLLAAAENKRIEKKEDINRAVFG